MMMLWCMLMQILDFYFYSITVAPLYFTLLSLCQSYFFHVLKPQCVDRIQHKLNYI